MATAFPEAQPAPDLASPGTRRRLSPAARAAALHIVALWHIPEPAAARLLNLSHGEARVSGTLSHESLTRISLLIGIFKALNILFSEPLADRWVTLPNSNPSLPARHPWPPCWSAACRACWPFAVCSTPAGAARSEAPHTLGQTQHSPKVSGPAVNDPAGGHPNIN